MKVLNDITLILSNLDSGWKIKQEGGPIPSEKWLDLDPRNVKSISWMASAKSHSEDVGIFAKCASPKHFAKPINRKTAPITEQIQTKIVTWDQVKLRLLMNVKKEKIFLTKRRYPAPRRGHHINTMMNSHF